MHIRIRIVTAVNAFLFAFLKSTRMRKIVIIVAVMKATSEREAQTITGSESEFVISPSFKLIIVEERTVMLPSSVSFSTASNSGNMALNFSWIFIKNGHKKTKTGKVKGSTK